MKGAPEVSGTMRGGGKTPERVGKDDERVFMGLLGVVVREAAVVVMPSEDVVEVVCDVAVSDVCVVDSAADVVSCATAWGATRERSESMAMPRGRECIRMRAILRKSEVWSTLSAREAFDEEAFVLDREICGPGAVGKGREDGGYGGQSRCANGKRALLLERLRSPGRGRVARQGVEWPTHKDRGALFRDEGVSTA